jgi:hypothetical protein
VNTELLTACALSRPPENSEKSSLGNRSDVAKLGRSALRPYTRMADFVLSMN